jgi:hypothetical protein
MMQLRSRRARDRIAAACGICCGLFVAAIKSGDLFILKDEKHDRRHRETAAVEALSGPKPMASDCRAVMDG